MRTPGDEAELAAGFLVTEGLIDGRGDIVSIDVADPGDSATPHDEVVVRLPRPFDAAGHREPQRRGHGLLRHLRQGLDRRGGGRCAPIPHGPVVTRATLLALPARLREGQAVFGATGGLHAAGLFTPDGTLVALREDIGRHNALDKLVGSRLLAGELPLHDRVLLVSGRASSSSSRRRPSRASRCWPPSPPRATSPWRPRSGWA